MTCSSWPETEGYGCMNGGTWTSLDTNMAISQTAHCESLCRQQGRQQGTNGCCYLSVSVGCSWRPAGEVRSENTASGLAVACTFSGISSLVYRHLLSFNQHFKAIF